MKSLFITSICTLILSTATAQFIKEQSLGVQIGFGLSTPYYSTTSVVDDGFFAQGELIMKVKNWLELRPYAGVILTNSDGLDLDDNPTDEKATSKAFLMGGKLRLRAPIPYFAPYIEGGIGTSIGSFETVDRLGTIDKSGIIYHVPFSIGVELGKMGKVDIRLSYFFQPSVEQYAGAAAIGVEFTL